MGLRLARFNVMIDDPNRPEWQKNFFVGMAAPGGASRPAAALPVVPRHPDRPGGPRRLVYVVGLAFLMVSTIPTYSGKTMGKCVPRDWVSADLRPVGRAASALLVSFPFETLTVGHARLPRHDPGRRHALPQARRGISEPPPEPAAGRAARCRDRDRAIDRRRSTSPESSAHRSSRSWRYRGVLLREHRISARPKLVLASASPRRLALVAAGRHRAGRAAAGRCGRDAAENENPARLAKRLAREKAEVARKAARNREDLASAYILSADTVVVAGGRILPKAEVVDEAAACLRLLSGRAHRVYTSVCLVTPKDSLPRAPGGDAGALQAPVEREFERYLASGEWRGKAGGYAIQGLAGTFVIKLVGSYSNVVGPAALRDDGAARRRGISGALQLARTRL